MNENMALTESTYYILLALAQLDADKYRKCLTEYQRLLLEESAQDLLSELPQKMELNPGCALCLAPAEVDLEAASEYFDAHEPGWDLARLRQAQAAGKPVTLPRLVVTEGRYLLVQPGN